MSTLIQNYGFTKTYLQENNKKKENSIQWIGDYDGKMAKVQLDINDNGHNEVINMKLNNNELMNLLGVQPVQIPLAERLMNDFLSDEDLDQSVMPNRRKSRRRRYKPVPLDSFLGSDITKSSRRYKQTRRRRHKHRK